MLIKEFLKQRIDWISLQGDSDGCQDVHLVFKNESLFNRQCERFLEIL